MNHLSHILWIGGSPCAGKSTVADIIRDRYGIVLYQADDRA